MRTLPLIPADSPLRKLARQPRFLNDRLTVLLPANDYYVQAECARALEALGHRVVRVAIGQEGENLEVPEVLGRLMRAVTQHRPDCLLTINYTGFDRAGYFDEIIEAMGLPTAVWFVDSPFFLAEGYLPPAPNMLSAFVWDRSYVEPMRAHGMPDVSHLPLASCQHVFAKPSREVPQAHLPLCFVGHSLAILESYWRQRLSAPEIDEAQGVARSLRQDRGTLHRLLGRLGKPLDRRARVVALGNYLASRALRAELLGRVAGDGLHVFGDDAWRVQLPAAHVHGGCRYGAETARIYRHAHVNVNITNFQMPKTVNQRVFDVPAAGAFLLTDRQAELADYFKDDQEMVSFDGAEEMADKAQFYGRRPKARASIVARGRARVLAEHTYEHRMQALLAAMRKKHGRSITAGPKGSPCDSPRPTNWPTGEATL